MSDTNPSGKPENLMLIIGVVGIFTLLIGALGYAIWESGSHYEPQQINQFVVEQSAQDQPR